MRLKHKNIRIIAGLSIVIVLVCFLNTGCSDNIQDISASHVETEFSDVSDLETENSNMEPTVSSAISEEEVSVGDVHLFEREDKISTMFYDLQLDGVMFTDSIGGVTAESGREFMVLDVTLTAGSKEKVIHMDAQEFLMVCFVGDSVKSDSDEDYEKIYPLEEGIADGQLDNAWLAAEGEEKKGKLIYNVPKDSTRTVLLVYDSYTTGDFAEVVYGDGYMMTILSEDWSREESDFQIEED